MDVLRIGRISSLNYDAGTARVVYTDRDNSVTAELPLLSFEYNMPKVDELVLVAHLPNGGEAGVILGRFWNKKNIPPVSGTGIFRKDLSRQGNCVIEYNEASKQLTINCPGGININGEIISNNKVTVNGEIIASGDINGLGISLLNHTHGGVETGNGNTGVPN